MMTSITFSLDEKLYALLKKAAGKRKKSVYIREAITEKINKTIAKQLATRK